MTRDLSELESSRSRLAESCANSVGAPLDRRGWLFVAIVVVGALLAARAISFGLSWDDASFVMRGMRIERETRHENPLDRSALLVNRLFHNIDGRPPFFNGYLACWSMILPRTSPLPMLVVGSAVPFVCCCFVVQAVGAMLAGPRGRWMALAIYLATPLCVMFGYKTMQETFLSLAALVAVTVMAKLIGAKQHRVPLAIALGISLGCALMVKQSALAVLWPPLLVAPILRARRQSVREALTETTIGAVVCLALAGPWYFVHMRLAIWHAMRAINTNTVWGYLSFSLLDRFFWLIFCFGLLPPLAMVLALGRRWGARKSGAPPTPSREIQPLRRDWTTLALATIAGNLAMVPVFPYWEPKYILPAAPIVSLTVAIVLTDAVERASAAFAKVLVAAVVVSLALSVFVCSLDEPFLTDWRGIEILDQIHVDGRPARIGLIGDTGIWNIYKLEYMNEFTHDPSARQIVYVDQLPAEGQNVLAGLDRLIVVDWALVDNDNSWGGYVGVLNRRFDSARKAFDAQQHNFEEERFVNAPRLLRVYRPISIANRDGLQHRRDPAEAVSPR